MAYSVRVERISAGGMPEGAVAFYETAGEIEAVAVASHEVDAYRSGPKRVATVFDAAGRIVLAYAGSVGGATDAVGAADAGR